MRPISEKQKQILQFIQEYTASEGYPPAVREIAAAVGLRSPSSVHAHVKHLRELGYLEQCAGKTRTVKITGQTGTTAVPLLGRVAAGQPILAVEEQQAMLYIDLHGKSGSYFALHVRGDSMVNVGILSGDTIIVQQAILRPARADCRCSHRRGSDVQAIGETRRSRLADAGK